MQFFGNLSADAQTKFAKTSGKQYQEFTVIENQGREPNRTKTAYRVRAFNLSEAVAAQLTKGRRVSVKGTLTAEPWMGQDNSPRATLQVVTGLVEIQENRTGGDDGGGYSGAPANRAPAQSRPAQTAPAPAAAAQPATGFDDFDDDIPF